MLRRKMKLESLPEQLFTTVVGMDPLLDGFSGVLVDDLSREGVLGWVPLRPPRDCLWHRRPAPKILLEGQGPGLRRLRPGVGQLSAISAALAILAAALKKGVAAARNQAESGVGPRRRYTSRAKR